MSNFAFAAETIDLKAFSEKDEASRAEWLISQQQKASLHDFHDLLDELFWVSPTRYETCGFLSQYRYLAIHALMRELVRRKRGDIANQLLRYCSVPESGLSDDITRAIRDRFNEAPKGKGVNLNFREHAAKVKPNDITSAIYSCSSFKSSVLKQIAKFQHLRFLYMVNDTNRYVAATDGKLSKLQTFSELETINFSNLPITGELFRSGFRRIELLSLRGCKIDERAAHLVSLENLSAIDLTGTKISNRFVASAAHGLPKLRMLCLAYTALDDECLNDLGQMQQLRNLDVRNTWISRDGLSRLRKMLPNCKVQPSEDALNEILSRVKE